MSTVEDLLDIPIDKYVTVDFNGFKDVIDEVGGVDVKVPFDFDEMSDVSKKKRIYFKKGNMHLNGEQALAYARMRKQDKRGDFGRNDRQKQILNALIDQMSRAGNIAKIDKIAETASNNVQTNIRITEGLALQQIYSGFTSKKIDTLTITGSDLYLGGTATTRGTYYFQPDPTNLEKYGRNCRNIWITHPEAARRPILLLTAPERTVRLIRLPTAREQTAQPIQLPTAQEQAAQPIQPTVLLVQTVRTAHSPAAQQAIKSKPDPLSRIGFFI